MLVTWKHIYLLIQGGIYVCHSATIQRGLDFIPERVEITYINKKYAENVTSSVRKLGRRGAYAVSLQTTIKHSWNNNVSVEIDFQEYLNNVYKPTFVKMQFKFCDFINKDNLFGDAFRRHGFPNCPIPAGLYELKNFTFKYPTFRYVFPFEKCRGQVIIKTTKGNEIMGSGYLYISIKQFLENKN